MEMYLIDFIYSVRVIESESYLWSNKLGFFSQGKKKIKSYLEGFGISLITLSSLSIG